jgi:hypothetical protein
MSGTREWGSIKTDLNRITRAHAHEWNTGVGINKKVTEVGSVLSGTGDRPALLAVSKGQRKQRNGMLGWREGTGRGGVTLVCELPFFTGPS